MKGYATEVLLKGKAQYGWPPPSLTSLDQLVFHIENIIYLFTKQVTLMWSTTVPSHPPKLVFLV